MTRGGWTSGTLAHLTRTRSALPFGKKLTGKIPRSPLVPHFFFSSRRELVRIASMLAIVSLSTSSEMIMRSLLYFCLSFSSWFTALLCGLELWEWAIYKCRVCHRWPLRSCLGKCWTQSSTRLSPSHHHVHDIFQGKGIHNEDSFCVILHQSLIITSISFKPLVSLYTYLLHVPYSQRLLLSGKITHHSPTSYDMIRYDWSQ